MTLIYEKKLGEVVPHEVMSYHSYNAISDMSDYIVRSDMDDVNAQTFGLEIEVSRGSQNYTDTMVEKIFEIFPYCQIESDSSIPGYGFEIITQPMTLNAWREAPLKELFDYLKSKNFMAYGVTSTDTGDGCGGHIHVSKSDKWEDVVALMAMFLDQNKEIVQIICKRPFTYYAQNNLQNLGKSTKRYCLPEVKAYVLRYSDEHSRILNLQHRATIEFRLPIGTLNYETKMAHIEFLANLYKCCEDIVKGCARIDRLTINKVCQEGKFLPKYIKELCISCSKKLIVLDSEVRKQVREFEVKKNKLVKILSQLQYELSIVHDNDVRQGSINTITRYFNSIIEANNPDTTIAYINRMKHNMPLSDGLEEYIITHNNNITKYYKQLKDFVENIELDTIYQDIRDEQ